MAVIAAARPGRRWGSHPYRPFFFPRAGDFFALFFFADFRFADFWAGLAALFFAADDLALPTPKIDSQLSANFFVAPTRVLLIANSSPCFQKMSLYQ
jgi:hypothetical protein